MLCVRGGGGARVGGVFGGRGGGGGGGGGGLGVGLEEIVYNFTVTCL